MKKIGLLSLLLIGCFRLMAQNSLRTDSLPGEIKKLKSPYIGFQIPKGFKLNPKDSLLKGIQLFKPVSPDSFHVKSKTPFIIGFTVSRIDHMPIANLPSNSRTPVYKLPRSTDKMPGSNVPAPVTPVVP